MGYLTVYARIQNLVKYEAPGAEITDYIVQRGRLGATVTVQAVGPGNNSDNYQRTLAHRRLQD